MPPAAVGERRQGVLDRLGIALALEARQLVDLQLPYRGVVDLEQVDLRVPLGAILVHADDRLLAGVDARLRLRRGLLNAQLRQAGFDRLGHAAHLLDLRMWPQAALASS